MQKESNNVLQKLNCHVVNKCGGCQIQHYSYEKQLEEKQKQVNMLLDKYCKIENIIGMNNPYYYRNKVHAVFDTDKKGNVISGVYEGGTHRVVNIDSCLIEDQRADRKYLEFLQNHFIK